MAIIWSAPVNLTPFGVYPISIAGVVPGINCYMVHLLPVFGFTLIAGVNCTCHAAICPFIMNRFYPIHYDYSKNNKKKTPRNGLILETFTLQIFIT